MTVAADPSRTKTNVLRSARGRRGRLRAQLAGLAAVLGALFGALTLPQAAMAADFEGAITGGMDSVVDIGGSPATITVDIYATFGPGQGPKDVNVAGSLSGLDGLASVTVQDGGACAVTGEASAVCQQMTSGEMRQVQFIVTPAPESDLAEGAQQAGEFKVDYDGGNQKTSVTVTGHAPAVETTGKIFGKVTSNADPVEGAKVEVSDSEGNTRETTTGSDGSFEIVGSPEEPIVPGDLTLKVTKEDFEDTEQTNYVAANSEWQTNVTLIAVEKEEETSAPAESDEPSPTEAVSEASAEDEGGINGTLMILIIIGAILVIGGIVGIVFLLRGGKNDDKNDDDDGFAEVPPEHTPTAAQVGTPGVYQAGPAPGIDAPTTVYNGPLVSDQGAPAPGAPTQGFGPAYGPGAADSTQVMPQAGAAGPGPALGPDGTQLLPTVKNAGPGAGPAGAPPAPHAGGSDSTQVMPQVNPDVNPPSSALPPSAFADSGSQAAAAPSPTPPPASSVPSAGGSMFEPQNPSLLSGSQSAAPAQPGPYQSQPPQQSQPPASRDPYAPKYGHQSPPPGTGAYQAGSQGSAYQSQPPGTSQSYQPSQPPPGTSQSYQPPAPPQQSQPPARPGTGAFSAQPGGNESYPSGAMSRDPYAPPEQPGAPGTDYSSTRPIPKPGQDGQDGDANQRPESDRKGWGEWDDRPRSW